MLLHSPTQPQTWDLSAPASKCCGYMSQHAWGQRKFFFNSFMLYVSAHVVCICICMLYVYAHRHAKTRGQCPSIFLSHSLPRVLRSGLSPNLELTDWTRPDGHQAPGISLSLTPQHCSYTYTLLCCASHVCSAWKPHPGLHEYPMQQMLSPAHNRPVPRKTLVVHFVLRFQGEAPSEASRPN